MPTAERVKLVVRFRRGTDGLGITSMTPPRCSRRQLVIINCVAGGQADADGLLEPGDEVLSVDGTPLDGQPLGKVMQRGAESYDLVLTRRKIALATSVQRLLPGSEVAEAAAAGAPLRLLRLRLARGERGLGLDVSGLNVLKRVVPGSAADATGEWREGDVIVSVNGLELGAAKLVQALPKDTSTYEFGVLRAESRAAPAAESMAAALGNAPCLSACDAPPTGAAGAPNAGASGAPNAGAAGAPDAGAAGSVALPLEPPARVPEPLAAPGLGEAAADSSVGSSVAGAVPRCTWATKSIGWVGRSARVATLWYSRQHTHAHAPRWPSSATPNPDLTSNPNQQPKPQR